MASVVRPRACLSGLTRSTSRLARSAPAARWTLGRDARCWKSTEAAATPLTALKINGKRMMEDLHYTCQWGTGKRWGKAETETGMSRLALSDADKQARDWFAETTTSLGCTLTIDEMGNMFAVLPGTNSSAPATFAGSHLDTQPSGGRYDGILGVHAGVEMLRTLRDSKAQTRFPVGVANWTNEEGARFPISMVASGVWAGAIPLARAHGSLSVSPADSNDKGSVTLLSELKRIGYHHPQTPCSYSSSHSSGGTPMAAHFELHIEQGPTLENEQRRIGIVTGAQAYKWFTVSVSGREAHTGTTDLLSRHDALLAASAMIVRARAVASENDALASVGTIAATPGSVNTIPGAVSFSLDVRAATDDGLARAEQALRDAFDAISASGELPSMGMGVELDRTTVSWTQDFHSPAVTFHPDCIDAVTAAARDVFGDDADKLSRRMVSGAGHDSVYTSRRVPTSMIFVPSRRGVSHHPEEYTSPDDCALGAQVLMNAVLRFDQRRTE